MPAVAIEGVLLDVEPAAPRGVHLFVRTAAGVCELWDESYRPSFHAVGEADLRAHRLELAGLAVRNGAIVDCEVVTRVDGRRPRAALRLLVDPPAALASAAEAVVARGLVPRDADLPLAQRYVLDRELVPWQRVRAEATGDGRVSAIAAMTGLPPAWAAMALEVVPREETATLDPSSDPVGAIRIGREGEAERVLAGDDERAILQSFVALVRDVDPDVLVTYDGDATVLPHVLARCAAVGVRPLLGAQGREAIWRPPGRPRLPGRAHVDLLRLSERDLPDVKLPTVENVAESLRVGGEGTRRLLAIARALVPSQIELAQTLRLPLDEVARAGRGRQVDAYLVAESHRRGILPPGEGDERALEEYEGGFVLSPPKGLFERVVALDFASMYPNLMVRFNVSPETYLPTEERADAERVHVAPEVGHRFLREPQGFVPRVLEELLAARRELRGRLAAAPSDGGAWSALDARQKAVKVLTNAVYGYTGWGGARWYRRECAQATAAWGRHFIKEAIALAQEHGLLVLYGDTDSLFLQDDPGVDAFVDAANARLPVQLEVQDRFESLLFTGAKKRYAGQTREGELVVRGFEVRRGDWCSYARRAQAEVLEALLSRRDAEAGLAAARAAIARLREGRVPLSDLVIHKSLTQRPGGYKAKPAHAAALERAQRERPGLRAPVGTKIGFVVVEGQGSLASRARLARFLAADERADLRWYEEKQVVPAVVRVLEPFGKGPDDVRVGGRQQTLADWF